MKYETKLLLFSSGKHDIEQLLFVTQIPGHADPIFFKNTAH
jgi:hypothetical protein